MPATSTARAPHQLASRAARAAGQPRTSRPRSPPRNSRQHRRIDLVRRKGGDALLQRGGQDGAPARPFHYARLRIVEEADVVGSGGPSPRAAARDRTRGARCLRRLRRIRVAIGNAPDREPEWPRSAHDLFRLKSASATRKSAIATCSRLSKSARWLARTRACVM